MPSTRKSGTENPISLTSTTKVTRILFVSTLAAVAFCLLVLPVHLVRASGSSLQIGNLNDPAPLASCPGSGWYSYTNSQGQVTPMSCFTNTVSNCLNAQTLQFNYGFIYPVAPYKGTIVFLSGADGMTPSRPEDQEQMFADYYYKAGYEIVQVEWNAPWEQTDVPAQSNTPYAPNIQLAACRPGHIPEFRPQQSIQQYRQCWHVRPGRKRRFWRYGLLVGLLWGGELHRCRGASIRAGAERHKAGLHCPQRSKRHGLRTKQWVADRVQARSTRSVGPKPHVHRCQGRC